ncbi:hypothetical protein J6590_030026 [Homalodisca vitripennis]|nr:hypothetical protein J6590_030026 [Homalodisca vitripennis]
MVQLIKTDIDKDKADKAVDYPVLHNDDAEWDTGHAPSEPHLTTLLCIFLDADWDTGRDIRTVVADKQQLIKTDIDKDKADKAVDYPVLHNDDAEWDTGRAPSEPLGHRPCTIRTVVTDKQQLIKTDIDKDKADKAVDYPVLHNDDAEWDTGRAPSEPLLQTNSN